MISGFVCIGSRERSSKGGAGTSRGKERGTDGQDGDRRKRYKRRAGGAGRSEKAGKASRGEGEEGRIGRAELCVQNERRGAKGLDQIGERRKKPAAPGTGRAGAEQQGGTGKKQKHIKTGDKEGKECTEKMLKEMAYSKASLQKAGKRRLTRKQKRTGKRKE